MRCAGCGKPIEKSQRVFQITRGTAQGDGELRLGHVWGVIHLSCFARAVDSPELVLEEIRSLASSSDSRRPVAAASR